MSCASLSACVQRCCSFTVTPLATYSGEFGFVFSRGRFFSEVKIRSKTGVLKLVDGREANSIFLLQTT